MSHSTDIKHPVILIFFTGKELITKTVEAFSKDEENCPCAPTLDE
jgi:hypothetical protein